MAAEQSNHLLGGLRNAYHIQVSPAVEKHQAAAAGPDRGLDSHPREASTMPWPLSQDYNEAIQNPGFAFHDPELKGGQAATNAIGLPAPRSGNFADVYEVHCPA